MYMTWNRRARIHIKRCKPSLLLVVTLLTIHICTIVVTAEPELNFTSHVGQDFANPGRTAVKYVSSNHMFRSSCSEKLVRILPRRKLDANGSDRDRYSELLVTSESFGLVRFQNALNKKFICFNSRGKLKVKHSFDSQCVFEEQLVDDADNENTYMYKSKQYGYYLGFNKNGKKLKGKLPRKRRRQKCYQFLKSSGLNSIKTKVTEDHHGKETGDFTDIVKSRHIRHLQRKLGEDAHFEGARPLRHFHPKLKVGIT